MADPTRYTPGFNYSGWEADHPTEPKPGAELDNDFALIRHSIDETIRALKDVRRSDGKVQNAAVDFDALSPAVKAAIANSDFDYEVIDDLLAKAANLQDIPDKGEARDNLGVVARDANLSDLTDLKEARANLGTFPTVADIVTRKIPAAIAAINTLGRSIPGDGGGALLIEGDSSDPGAIQDNDGKWWRIAERIVRPQMFGAVGDGVTDDQAALEATINFALLTGAEIYWPDNDFVSAGNLSGFWNVKHSGPGRILRNGNTWHITPVKDERNVVYVKDTGSTSNDGLSESEPTTLAAVNDRIKNLGAKAGNGIWRIQLIGTLMENGIRAYDWPVFTNPVEIHGEEVGTDVEPLTVWDGTSSTEPYAFRADNYNSVLNLHFKDIKFINWDNGTGQSGALVVWAPGVVYTENCWAENCAGAFRYRNNFVRHYNGTIKNCSVYGIAGTYNCTLHVGNLGSGGVTIEGCDIGVRVSRSSIGYVQGNTFNGSFLSPIEVSKVSRIATGGNDFSGATFAQAVRSMEDSVWNPGATVGAPDIYPTLSQSQLAYKLIGGGLNFEAHKKASRMLHQVSSAPFTVSGTTNQTLLADLNSSWAPFRIPAYTLYDPDAVLDVEVIASIGPDAEGELALHGSGSSVLLKLASVTIPTRETQFTGAIRIRVFNVGNSNTARALVEVPALGISTYDSTVSFDHNLIRANTENLLIFRLYWTPSTTGSAQFIHMRSYLEA